MNDAFDAEVYKIILQQQLPPKCHYCGDRLIPSAKLTDGYWRCVKCDGRDETEEEPDATVPG